MKSDILYVVGSLDLGGTEKHLARITPRLKEMGWHPTIYCLSHTGAQADSVAKAGVTVLAPRQSPTCRRSRLSRAASLVLSAVKLFVLLVRQRPAIAHFFLPVSYAVGGPMALLARVPLTIMSRRSLNLYQKQHPVAAKWERFLHPRMSALLGNSQSVVRELVEKEKCPPERVGLIYNGIELSEHPPSRPSNAPLRLISVANLIPYKGHADLLQALGEIKTALPHGWKLNIVGRDDGEGDRLQQQIGKLHLDGHVEFLGSRTDVDAQLQGADIFVSSSHEEGFSNAVLEAMGAGLPAVVTDVGGNPEAVLDGETGLIVPPRNPLALARAILSLARSPVLRTKMGKAGYQRAKMLFSIDACVKLYDETYRELIRSGRLPEAARVDHKTQ